MSKKTKALRRQAYLEKIGNWAFEDNARSLYNEYLRLNEKRDAITLQSYEDIVEFLGNEHDNNMINAYKKLPKDKIIEYADLKSKYDYKETYNLSNQDVVSLKQAVRLAEGAHEIGGTYQINGRWVNLNSINVDSILNGAIDYYSLNKLVQKILGIDKNAADLYLFGS